ncbi:MAG: hypothetical protein RLZZ385_1640 [Pseudomonadota bacterium]|jgi:toxin CcdB
MAQFDVYPNPSASSRQIYPYLVDVQSGFLALLDSRIVIPLGDPDRMTAPDPKRLTPMVEFQDRPYVLVTTQVSSLRASVLSSAPTGSLVAARDKIMDALDFVFTGF